MPSREETNQVGSSNGLWRLSQHQNITYIIKLDVFQKTCTINRPHLQSCSSLHDSGLIFTTSALKSQTNACFAWRNFEFHKLQWCKLRLNRWRIKEILERATVNPCDSYGVITSHYVKATSPGAIPPKKHLKKYLRKKNDPGLESRGFMKLCHAHSLFEILQGAPFSSLSQPLLQTWKSCRNETNCLQLRHRARGKGNYATRNGPQVVARHALQVQGSIRKPSVAFTTHKEGNGMVPVQNLIGSMYASCWLVTTVGCTLAPLKEIRWPCRRV